MTAQDIQQGRMMVESAIAAVRPAEFIFCNYSVS
jgi:phage tail sheath protein FI